MKWWTSDNHFDHDNIVVKMGRLGFDTIEEHNETILEWINSCVEKRDFLFINGDFAFKRAMYWRGRIRCKNIVFCLGNHDRPAESLKAFGTIHLIKCAKLDCGEQVVNSHYPIAYWPASHHGAYHFYGHCHQQREATLDGIWPERRSIDVGVDNAKLLLGEHRPFSENELMDLLRGRAGHDQKSFYEELRNATTV